MVIDTPGAAGALGGPAPAITVRAVRPAGASIADVHVEQESPDRRCAPQGFHPDHDRRQPGTQSHQARPWAPELGNPRERMTMTSVGAAAAEAARNAFAGPTGLWGVGERADGETATPGCVTRAVQPSE